MSVDEAASIQTPLGSESTALVTTATSAPALRTGFAVLGLVSLLDLPRADRADRVVALSAAAAAGWFLVRGSGLPARLVDQGRAPGLISSSISVTRAAIGERSLRSRVMWANSG